jgi:hypothetical protein
MDATTLFETLLEETDSPFTKAEVTLQYRPFQIENDWKWFWVLLPADNSKALAHGQEDNRAQAAVAGRAKARELGVAITKVEVMQ